MAVSQSNGVKFFIGTTKAATDATSYASDTFIEVKSIKDLGEFGDESNEIKYETLGENRVHRLAGTRDAGAMTITCVADNADPGQLAMTAANNGLNINTNFKVLLNDGTAAGTGTVYYFSGLVMSARRKVGSANEPVTIDFKLGINTGQTAVAAS